MTWSIHDMVSSTNFGTPILVLQLFTSMAQ